MPVLKKRVVKENHITAVSTGTVDITITEGTTTTVNAIDNNSATLFYDTIIELLTASGLDFTYDASKYSVNIFGITLYFICRVSNSVINNYLTATHPWVFYDGQIDANCGFTTRNNTMAYSGTSYTKATSITHFKLLQYQINLYYNTNYICITYNSATNINKEFPLVTLVSCKNHENKEYIYITNSISDISQQVATNSDSTGVNTTPTQHAQRMHKVLIDKEDIYKEITNIPRANETNLAISWSPQYYFPDEYSDKVLLMPLTLCDGAITAENIYIDKKAYSNFSEGKYYTINGDTYYCVSGYNNGTIMTLLKM